MKLNVTREAEAPIIVICSAVGLLILMYAAELLFGDIDLRAQASVIYRVFFTSAVSDCAPAKGVTVLSLATEVSGVAALEILQNNKATLRAHKIFFFIVILILVF